MGESDRGCREPRRWESRGLALLLALLALALFFRDRHTGLYGDGPALLDLWAQGGWFYIHLLFLPIVRLCHGVLSLVCGLRPHETIQAVSLASAICLAALTVRLAARLSGSPPFALAAGGLLLCTAALRFHAGAVEIHALSALAAALSAQLVLQPARTRRGGVLALLAAYLLVVAGHLSCLVLGPALLLLHLHAERRAGRPATLSTALGHGSAAIGALLCAALILLLLDRFAFSSCLPWKTGFRGYAEYIFFHYGQGEMKLPGSVALFSEIIAPYGPLLALAVAGIAPAFRRGPFLAAGLVFWVGALIFATLRIGAREYGAYLLPALPALGLLAAFGLEGLSRALRPWGLLASLLALLFLQLALLAWASDLRLDQGQILVYPHPWVVSGAELGLPGWRALFPVARLLPWPLYLLAGLAAALCQPLAFGVGRPNRGVPAATGVLLFALTVGAFQLGMPSFRACWPRIWNQPWTDYAIRAAHRTGSQDVLVSAALNYQDHYRLAYALENRLVNLWALDEPDSERGKVFLETARRLCRQAQSEGGAIVLSADGLALLGLAEQGRGTPRPNARAFLTEFAPKAQRWPITEARLRASYLALHASGTF